MGIDELTKVRARDDILIISELPLTDGQPPQLDLYTPIYDDEKPRVCAYVKDRSLRFIDKHTTHPNLIQLFLVNNRIVSRAYTTPPYEIPDYIFTPMKEGEVQIGDYNTAHSNFFDGDPDTIRGKQLVRWQKDQKADERGPDYPTHDKGRKLDLIFTKDNRKQVTKIMHNGRIEHSDHDCQSVMIPLRLLASTPTKPQVNYQKVNHIKLRERIETMKLPHPKNPEELI